MSFADRLAAAKASRPSRDVQVVLDGELSRELESLQEQLEAVAEDGGRLGVKTAAAEIEERMEAVRAAAQEAVVTLRFTRLPGREWAAITSKWPPRADVPIDRHYGFDYDSVCEEAATASGVRVEGGEEVALEPDEWRELFDVLSGRDVQDIRDIQWALNEHEPQQRLSALVKGFGATTRSDQN